MFFLKKSHKPETSSSSITTSLSTLDSPSLARVVSHSSNSHAPAADTEKHEASPNSQPAPEFERKIHGFRWILVCTGFYLSAFLYGLDNTIAADIQSAVLDTYGEIEKLTWLGTGFPLGSIATILTLGKAYGIFNVKWTHISSVTLFTVGSAVCGAAPNMNALIVGRVIAGAGGAGMYLGNLNIISINTTMRERSAYMAGVGVVWGAGTILGPVIGGSFADSKATWRWAFYINLVIFGLMFPAPLSIPSFNPKPNTKWQTKLKQLDWVGVVLNAGLYTSFVLALTFRGSSWAWSSGRTIATFVSCLAILVLFSLQQWFSLFTTPQTRLFPIAFLKARTMILLHIATAAAGTALFVPIFYVPLLFQFVRGDSGLQAAVRLLPFIMLYIATVMGQGILMPRVGYYMPFFVLSGVLALIGASLIFTATAGTSPAAIYGYSILIAVGAGLTSQSSYSIAPAKVRPEQVSAAIGFINVAQIGGIVIALAISGTVFQNTAFKNLSQVLDGLGFSDVDIKSAIAGAQSVVFDRIDGDVRGRAIDGIVAAIRKTYALIIAGSSLALVTSVFLKREKLFMEVSTGGA